MHSIITIARNTISEALSRVILQMILVFAIIFLVLGFFFTFMTPGEEDRMLKDLGLTVITGFGLLLAIFMGVSLIQPEVERRTIYALLAKPVRRLEFVLGKYAGTIVVLALAMIVMGVVLVGSLFLKQGVWSPELLIALVGVFFALMIMAALVMMISTFASTLMSVIAGFLFWSIGYAQTYLQHLSAHADNPVSVRVLDTISAVLPNFTYLDLRLAVVDGLSIPAQLLGKMALYGVGYAAVVLAIAAVLFNEREL
jgi:ABC-type transport system involved in multi-copper enzyme maturation permease subunit